MSDTLKSLIKLLDKHDARLTIQSRNDENEIVLTIPTQFDGNRTFMPYAVEYRLGQQFPQPPSTPRPTEPLESDPTT